MLAGLGTPEGAATLQAAFIAEQAPEAGDCLDGWIMTAAAFLDNKPRPTDSEIAMALDGVKCRCGTHVSILKAVKRAAAMGLRGVAT